MEIEEIKKRKREVEVRIADEVNAFSKETGLIVAGLSVSITTRTEPDGRGITRTTSSVVTKAEIEISL